MLRIPLLDVVLADDTLGKLYAVENERAFFFFTGLRLLNLCERLGPSPHLTDALYARQALAGVATATSPPPRALIYLGTYYLGLGQWEQAQRAIEQGIATSDRLGEWKLGRGGLIVAGLVLSHQGKFEESAAHFWEFYQAACDKEDVEDEIVGLMMQGWVLLVYGQTEPAIELVERARAMK